MTRVQKILATLLFFAVSRTFNSSPSSSTGYLNTYFGADAAEQLDNSTSSSSSEKTNLLLQRGVSCSDRSPHCKKWAEVGECRKKNGRQYMKDNCPYSCNLCNPLLEAWTPRKSNPYTKTTFDSQKEIDFEIFTGVEQKIDFSDSPLHKHPHETPNKPTIFQHDYIASRIHDIAASQSTYLDIYYHNRDVGDDLISSIDIDKLDNKDINTPDLQHLPNVPNVPLPESCLNLHPYCANWAVKGFCDSRPDSMMNMCAPICFLCKFNSIDKGKISVVFPTHMHISPFQRHDLFGVIDAIQEDRVNIDWVVDGPRKTKLSVHAHVSTTKQQISGKNSTHLDTKSIKKTVFIWNRSRDQTKKLKEVMQSNETGVRQQRVIVMQNFTSPEVCRAILDAVKFGVGLDSASSKENRGDDGFSEKLMYVMGEKDEASDKVIRNSSSMALHPTLKSGNSVQFAPSIEMLLEKLALVVGIPFSHIETPLGIEKFMPGEFRSPMSHFKDAIRNTEARTYFQSSVKPLEEYANTTFTGDSEPLIMENARVFGAIIFLSDVEDGGSIYFPNMANSMQVKPEIGKVVLFPAVVSLNGIWNDDVYPIDAQYDNFGDLSYLVEDMSTLVGHKEVVSGTKYAITVYFRRYEMDDLN